MSRLTHLKIKIKTLAAEARIIRTEEQRALERARHPWSGAAPTTAADAYTEHASLREHRTGPVRQAARTNLLAYGFLRGRAYAQMEHRVVHTPDLREVHKHLRRFATEEELAGLAEWFADARAHLRAQAPGS